MKSIFKIFGIITLTAVIMFGMAACGDGGGGGGGGGNTKLTVVNNWSSPITKVDFMSGMEEIDFEDETGIPAGESKTFTIKMKKKEDSSYCSVTLNASGLNSGMGQAWISGLWVEYGKTTTVTLNSTGTVTGQ